MSEELNRDPLLGQLARFQPSSPAIDRDGLLFAMGKASAPKTRWWKVAVVALAVCQAATLGIWLMGFGERPAAIVPSKSSEPKLELPTTPSPASPPEASGSYLEMVRRWERNGFPAPAPVNDPEPAGPVLSVAATQQVLGTD
ncbi:MAG TPA: hypothetical protein VKS79_05270 [Gemmataceae bacterium]|nr:hypothetical protein [Gemmataceae bacterium]